MRFDSVSDLAGWALQRVRRPDGGLFTRDEMRRQVLEMERAGVISLRRYPSGAVSVVEVRAPGGWRR